MFCVIFNIKNISFSMKIFGFNMKNEKFFVHVTCNILLGLTILLVFALSVFSPIVTQAYMASNGAIYKGNTQSNNVSLMINVYWGTECLDEMLNTLKDNDVHTTFFVGGCWVAKNNDMLKKIYEGGHEIGSHGYFHKDHVKLSATQNRDEIYMTGELVKSIIGVEMNLFAPPSGSVNEKVVNVATQMGYQTIMWSKDTIDWRDKDEEVIFKRATSNISSGDLVLMHPTECTARALDRIIKEIKSKGLNITPVSNTIS